MTDYHDMTDLRAMPSGLDCIAAAERCAANHENAAKEARRIRNREIRVWVAEHGPAATARAIGMPLPTVKAITGPR